MDKKNKLISQLKTSHNTKEAFEILAEICELLGFKQYMFTQMATQDSPYAFKANYINTNYLDKWVETYLEKNYMFVDPVAQRVLSNETPFYWSEHLASAEISKESAVMMSHAAEYGFVDGIGCSYLKNKGQLYTFTISTAEPITNYDQSFLAEIYLIGSYLAEAHQKEFRETIKQESLTTREKEIVSMAALGKTDVEIAQMAGISKNTVRYHWKNIFEKIDCYSRVFAIIRALNLGYIDTHLFELTTENGSIEIYRKAV